MKTRSGITSIMNDADGSVSIEDPSGNKYFMDGNGNTTVDAPKNLTLNAGEDIIISAGKDITTNAGQNINETAIGYKETKTGLYYSISVGTDYLINVIGRMSEYIKGNKESRTEKDRTRIANGKITAQSQGTHEQHSEKEIKNNSSENTIMF
jgi:uncharacterized protein (DUF2345 family)